MLKDFITSFKLKNTYRTNSVIYSIKQFPFIKKILPSSLYKNKGLKIFANIISVLIEIITTFLGKFLYMLLAIQLGAALYKTNLSNTFLHIFFFLTIVGGMMNTYIFNPTKDKYYAIIIMNMNAKKYALTNYLYFMIRVIIGFLPFTIVSGMMCKIPLWLCILLPFYVVMVKSIIAGYEIIDYEKHNVVKNENKAVTKVYIMLASLLILAYGLPAINIVLNQMIFIMLFILCIPFAIFAIYKICKFNKYRQMYKQMLTIDNVYVVENANSTATLKQNVSKQIELDKNFTSNKKGFAYFHELFVKRHKKILTEAIKKQSFVIIGIFLLIFVISKVNPPMMNKLENMPLKSLPYFVFIMYLLNRGTTMTQAMFMNCDHSMLTYRIYRTPKVVLGVFKERLKTLMVLNSIPALLIGLGLSMILFISSGTNNFINYLIIIVTLLAMSIFFSVHYLVMYYLLQPYNINTEIKSSTYKFLQGLTYVVCYFMIDLKMTTFYFGIAMIVFSVLYSVVSLYLVYKYAPKTFKIRT